MSLDVVVPVSVHPANISFEGEVEESEFGPNRGRMIISIKVFKEMLALHALHDPHHYYEVKWAGVDRDGFTEYTITKTNLVGVLMSIQREKYG